jgi:hypothetical protein
MEFADYDFIRNPVVQNAVFFLESRCTACGFSMMLRSIESWFGGCVSFALRRRALRCSSGRVRRVGAPVSEARWIVPIPGTTKLHRLEENLGVADLELTPEDLRELDIAASKIPVQGDRYPEELLKMVGR